MRQSWEAGGFQNIPVPFFTNRLLPAALTPGTLKGKACPDIHDYRALEAMLVVVQIRTVPPCLVTDAAIHRLHAGATGPLHDLLMRFIQLYTQDLPQAG